MEASTDPRELPFQIHAPEDSDFNEPALAPFRPPEQQLMPLTVTDLQQFEKIMEQTTERMALAVESSMQAQSNRICCAVNAMTEQFITTNNTMTHKIGKHMETIAKDQHSSSTATSCVSSGDNITKRHQ